MTLPETLAQKPVIFVGGKGGVGKTTAAAALALHFARAARKTLVISTDPAHSLGDVFIRPLKADSTQITPYLDAVELDPALIIHQHFEQVEQTLAGYTRAEMMPKIREFLQLSHHAPGAEEAAILEAVCRQLINARSKGYQHIIFDTAPTGHTLRLLSLPEMMQAWTDGLLAQQRRQNALRDAAAALDRQINPFLPERENRWASAVRILRERRDLFARTREILHDPEQTAIVLVLIPEMLPLAETERAVKQLQAGHLPCAGLIVNQVMAKQQQDSFWQQRADRQQEILARLDSTLGDLAQWRIGLQAEDIRGIQALTRLVTGALLTDTPVQHRKTGNMYTGQS